MEYARPSLQQGDILVVKAVELSSIEVEINGARYRAHCLPRNDNPPAAPLSPDDQLIVNHVNPNDAYTTAERVTSQQQRDGCRYALYNYEAR
jgi:hypothetical protein